MSETLVERMAREMYALNEFVRDWDHPKTAAMWHDLYRRKALAALRAMREPTLRMIGWTDIGDEDSLACWQDMIDAAIKEASE